MHWDNYNSCAHGDLAYNSRLYTKKCLARRCNLHYLGIYYNVVLFYHCRLVQCRQKDSMIRYKHSSIFEKDRVPDVRNFRLCPDGPLNIYHIL